MENASINESRQMAENWEKNRKWGKVITGLVFVSIGALLLARELGAQIPYWIFSWKMLLIVIGLASGIKHRFQRFFWLFPFSVGTIFLLNDFYPGILNENFFWPAVLIAIGIFIMLKPSRKYGYFPQDKWKKKWQAKMDVQEGIGNISNTSGSGNNAFEINAIFSGVRKTILTKDFKSGEINAILGGAEVNMAQVEIQDKATLEVTSFMGGIKLYMPSNWEIRSEINCVMGGVEDKRYIRPELNPENTKVLLLTGTAILGGIEIRS